MDEDKRIEPQDWYAEKINSIILIRGMEANLSGKIDRLETKIEKIEELVKDTKETKEKIIWRLILVIVSMAAGMAGMGSIVNTLMSGVVP